MRLVGSGLGSSPGCGGFLSLSQTRLPSLRKGKESCRGVRGEVRGSGGSAGEEASGSDILTGYGLWLFFFSLCIRSPLMVHKEEEEGGLHLLHGKSVCGRARRCPERRWRSGATAPCSKGAREVRKEGRGRKVLLPIKGKQRHADMFCDLQVLSKITSCPLTALHSAPWRLFFYSGNCLC